jgi:hypothetical protein
MGSRTHDGGIPCAVLPSPAAIPCPQGPSPPSGRHSTAATGAPSAAAGLRPVPPTPPPTHPHTHPASLRAGRYYVRQCAKPKARAAIGLAVRAGSVLEDEHERGVAHILEHLAFNATQVGPRHAAAALHAPLCIQRTPCRGLGCQRRLALTPALAPKPPPPPRRTTPTTTSSSSWRGWGRSLAPARTPTPAPTRRCTS